MTDESTEVSATAPSNQRRKLRYADTFADFSESELQVLCEIKRFLECYEGDRKFREALEAGELSQAQRDWLAEIGISFAPEDVALLFEQPDIMNRINTCAVRLDSFDELPSDIHEALGRYPILYNWALWQFRRSQSSFAQKKMVLTTPTNSPKYTAWRSRRINAVRSELGMYGWDIDHPCHAIELAIGCSVQCGFCAFDAAKLQQLFSYDDPENRELFQSVAKGMANQLGWPSGHGMLYWSTEPHDNPNYVDFLRDWERYTGAAMCTATARADDAWVQQLMEFYGRIPSPWPRISVLGRKIMQRLHKDYSPMQLRDLTMLMQQSDAEFAREKVPGGRERMLKQLVEADDLRDVDADNPPEDLNVPQGSIACVSGFLINMLNKTIRLISPCYTSFHYRQGYRTFDEMSFEGKHDFEQVLQELIDRNMVEVPYSEMPVGFRDDFRYIEREDGFTLVSPNCRHDFRSRPEHKIVGELIRRGDMTYGGIVDSLIDDHGVSPITAGLVLRHLFDKGYLDEIAICNDHRARYLASRSQASEPATRAENVAVPA